MRKVVTALFSALALYCMPLLVFAQEHAAEAASGGSPLLGLAAGLCMGIAAFGGALGQGKAASAALEGIGRNPGAAGKIQAPMIIALAMTESLVLFSLLVAIMLWVKLG